MFGVDYVVTRVIPVGDSQSRFNYLVLKNAIESMITMRVGDTGCKLSDFVGKTISTFIVAKFADDLAGWLAIFRTYSMTDNTTSFTYCPLWMAARATYATPTIFIAIQIAEGIYMDGCLSYSNPAEVALDEAK